MLKISGKTTHGLFIVSTEGGITWRTREWLEEQRKVMTEKLGEIGADILEIDTALEEPTA